MYIDQHARATHIEDYTLHFRKKFSLSLSQALENLRYYRANNKHGGQMERGEGRVFDDIFA